MNISLFQGDKYRAAYEDNVMAGRIILICFSYNQSLLSLFMMNLRAYVVCYRSFCAITSLLAFAVIDSVDCERMQNLFVGSIHVSLFFWSFGNLCAY